MRAVLALLLVLGGAGAVLFLILAGRPANRGPGGLPPAPASSSGRPHPRAAAPGTATALPRAATRTAGLLAAPPAAPSARASPLATSDADARLEERLRDGRKGAIREVLADWRTGRLTPGQDRRIDEALPSLDEAEVVKAAGHVLLEGATADAQRDGLLALLAAAGSEDAAEILIAASARPDLRREAVAALTTVSDMRALPRLAAAATPGQEREVLEAIAGALRNMDSEKARAVEERVRGALEGGR